MKQMSFSAALAQPDVVVFLMRERVGLVGEFALDEMGGDFTMGVDGTKESSI
jgi:hypothetical protein